MKRTLTMMAAVALLLAACGEGPPTTTGPDAQQVPPADAAPVFIDSWDIGTGEVIIRGDAPTPCHEVGWLVEETDTAIEVTVWSEAGDEACAQVLEPFEISVSFEPPSTEVPVLINGQEAGRVG